MPRSTLRCALRALAVVCLAGGSAAVCAAALTVGHIIVSGTPTTIKEFTSSGALVQTLPASGAGSFTTGMCFDSAGNLLVTNFSDGTIALYSGTTGALLNGAFITASGSPEACVRDAAGNFYVTSVGGVAAVRKFSPTGALLQSFLPGQRSDWLDLAADQCTMYWDAENGGTKIHKLDVCTGSALPDLGGNAVYTALRVLPGSGDIIVANSAGTVDRFSPAGTLLGSWTPTSPLGTVFALNLDPDGVTFWTGATGGSVHRFTIASFGPQISGFNSGNASLFGVTVVGEITVAAPPPPTVTGPFASEIPTLSEWALVLLAILVAAFAALRMRQGRR